MTPLDRTLVLEDAMRIYEQHYGPVGDARITLAAAVDLLLKRPQTAEDNAALQGDIAEHRALHLQAQSEGLESPFHDETFQVYDAARRAVRAAVTNMN